MQGVQDSCLCQPQQSVCLVSTHFGICDPTLSCSLWEPGTKSLLLQHQFQVLDNVDLLVPAATSLSRVGRSLTLQNPGKPAAILCWMKEKSALFQREVGTFVTKLHFLVEPWLLNVFFFSYIPRIWFVFFMSWERFICIKSVLHLPNIMSTLSLLGFWPRESMSQNMLYQIYGYFQWWEFCEFSLCSLLYLQFIKYLLLKQ